MCSIYGAKPLSKPVDRDSLLDRRVISSSELSQGPLQCLHIHYQSNETSTDIKDPKFVEHLYIDQGRIQDLKLGVAQTDWKIV